MRSDLATFALFVGAAENRSAPLFLSSGLTYAIGGPLTHLYHGQEGRAAASAGLRLGIPLVAYAVGWATSPAPRDDPNGAFLSFEGFVGNPVINGLYWAALSIPVAMLVDSVFVARKPIRDETARSNMALSPVWNPETGYMGLSAAGDW